MSNPGNPPAGEDPGRPGPLTTYREFYLSDANDPYDGHYGDLMHEFRVTHEPPANATLIQTVGNSDSSIPTAFLTLQRETGEEDATVRVIHAVSKFPSLVGRRTSWDGRLFAFAGDVVDGLISTVEFPADAFEFHKDGEYENAPGTPERVRELLEQNPGEAYLGPFNATDANVRQVRTRKFVPLPHKYVPVFLDRKVSARDACIDLTALLSAHEDEGACQPLIDWLSLAVTRSAAGALPTLARDPLVVPLGDRPLLAHRKALMLAHLPALGAPAPQTVMEATHQRLADTMGRMADEQRRARVDAEVRAQQTQAPTSVAKAFGKEGAATLVALCNVHDESQLPAFWHDVAGAGKRDRLVLEQALLGKARDLELVEAAPVATPDLAKKVVGLQWAGLSVDDLGEGIQPFSLVLADYVGSDAGIEAQRLAETYDILMTTDTTASLSDARTVKTSKVIIPKDLSEARAHLVALLVVWVVILGEEHPLVLALGQFVRLYTSREYSYQTKLRSLGTETPPAALLLRYVQLRVVSYWRKALHLRVLPTPPNFEELLDRLDTQDRSWIPTIPHKYWKPLSRPDDARSLISGLTSMPRVGFANTAPGGASTDSSSNATPTAGSSNPSGGGNPSTSGSRRSQQTQDKSPEGVSQIFARWADKIKSGSLKEAIGRAGQPPTVERAGKTVPMCLSYHLKGECWSGCARHEDHGPHDAGEDNALINWCQAAYA